MKDWRLKGYCKTCLSNDTGCLRGLHEDYQDKPGAWRVGEDYPCSVWKPIKVQMLHVCAWCGEEIREPDEVDWHEGMMLVANQTISHGICPKCSHSHFGQRMAKEEENVRV